LSEEEVFVSLDVFIIDDEYTVQTYIPINQLTVIPCSFIILRFPAGIIQVLYTVCVMMWFLIFARYVVAVAASMKRMKRQKDY